jgi:Spy/CpxP family protein refolding chaperone
VFGSGIVVGFAWDRRLDAAEAESYRKAQPEAGSDSGADSNEGQAQRGRPMYDQVGPTEAQRVRIDSIVAAYRQDVRGFHRESRQSYEDGMRSLVVGARDAIRGVFNPAQAEMYDSLTAAKDARDRRDEESRSERERN